jgi:hypothetical protein
MRCWFTLVLFLVPTKEINLLGQITQSGRCATIGETPDQRVTQQILVAPGQPPLLSFRVYESRRNGRFSNSDLMLDDAGH